MDKATFKTRVIFFRVALNWPSGTNREHVRDATFAALGSWSRADTHDFQEVDAADPRINLFVKHGPMTAGDGRNGEMHWFPQTDFAEIRLNQNARFNHPGFFGRIFGGLFSKAIDAEALLAHEIGHALGLDHSGPTGVMWEHNLTNRKPTREEIARLDALY